MHHDGYERFGAASLRFESRSPSASSMTLMVTTTYLT